MNFVSQLHMVHYANSWFHNWHDPETPSFKYALQLPALYIKETTVSASIRICLSEITCTFPLM